MVGEQPCLAGDVPGCGSFLLKPFVEVLDKRCPHFAVKVEHGSSRLLGRQNSCAGLWCAAGGKLKSTVDFSALHAGSVLILG